MVQRRDGNVVRSITPAGEVQVLIQNSGGQSSAPPGSFIGSNAMVADKDGDVLLCQHTNRRIVRVAKDLTMTPYLEKYQGKRFNSPNDLVYKSDGALYFTDPPYGLLKQDDDPAKELKFNGVFRYAGGKLQVVVKDLTRPNGLAFSPDEKTFYVSNSDEKHKVWMRYDVAPDGTRLQRQGVRRCDCRKGRRASRRHEGGFARATSTAAARAACGCSRRMASTWAPSSRARHRPTADGPKTAKHSTLPPAPACTASNWRWPARKHFTNTPRRNDEATFVPESHAGRDGRLSGAGAQEPKKAAQNPIVLHVDLIGGPGQREGDAAQLPHHFQARGREVSGLYRCEDVEAAVGPPGQRAQPASITVSS